MAACNDCPADTAESKDIHTRLRCMPAMRKNTTFHMRARLQTPPGHLSKAQRAEEASVEGLLMPRNHQSAYRR